MTDPIEDDDTEDADDELPDDYQPGRPVVTDKPELDVPGTPADEDDPDVQEEPITEPRED